MPIEVFTGLPGNGKTAFMVEKLIMEAKKGERPIFASGIDGLAPGLATTLDDPRKWNERDPDGEPTCDCKQDGKLHAHLVPDGALIFVDEAWKNFGHLHDAGRQATPPHVLALAEHRHRGIDFVWTTQQPNQLYPFARALCARHTHVVRRFGTQYCDLYSWEELNEDVKSAAKRENATKQTRMLPKQVFEQYKSATLHTIKRRLPLRLFVLPVAVIAALLCGYFVIQYLKPDNMSARLTPGGEASGLPDAPPHTGESRSSSRRPSTVAEYVEMQQPRIALAPWSAKLYDDRSPTVDPQLFCMALGELAADPCTCLTEQGTQYVIPHEQCRSQARNGPVYNPFKELRDERRGADQEFAPAPPEPSGGRTGAYSSGIGREAQEPAPAATFRGV